MSSQWMMEAAAPGEAVPTAFGCFTGFSSWQSARSLFRRIHLHAVPSREGTRQCQKRCCVRGVGSEARRLLSRPLGQGGLPTSLLHPCPLPKPASDANPNASSYPGLPGSPSDPMHITGIKGARFHCDVFSFPVSAHPCNKLPCENGFVTSQEMACSFLGLENCRCSWLCLKTYQSARGFLGSTLSAPVPLFNTPEDQPKQAPQMGPAGAKFVASSLFPTWVSGHSTEGGTSPDSDPADAAQTRERG